MDWRTRLQWLFRRNECEQDLDEEIRAHLDVVAGENIESGMPPDQAHRAARREFGNVALAKEGTRQVWIIGWLDTLAQDLRFAFRSFAKNPGSTAAAVTTLALGLGVGTAVFSVVNALLFKPLPYEDAHRLVMVWSVNEKEGVDLNLARTQGKSMSTSELEDWEKSGVFKSMVAFGAWTPIIYEPGEPEAILVYSVSPGFFEMTGVQPLLGRGFGPADGVDGNVVVITHEFWRRRFQEDPAIIGQELVIKNRNRMSVEGLPPFTVIGVLPPGFSFFSRQPAMITPIPRDSPIQSYYQSRRHRNLRAMARLSDGLSLEQAKERADVISAGLASRYPGSNEGWKIELVPVAEEAAGHLTPAMYALLAAIACVLFIACSNVANLFLVQFSSRSQELSMRYALGASRVRVLRQLLTESMLLSVSGGLLGFALAVQIVRYFRSLVPAGNTFSKYLVQVDGIEVDSTLALFALAVTLLAGILVVLIPVFRSSQFALESSLRNAGRSAFGNRGGKRSHNVLVMAEVAVAVVLVVASGLLLRSVSEMYQLGPGFDPEGVFFIQFSRTDADKQQELYGTTTSRREARKALLAWSEVRDREIQSHVTAVPGVESIASGKNPIVGSYRLLSVTAADDPTATVESLPINRAGPEYFETLRIPLLQGRTFELQDDNTENVIINEALATALWPDGDPIGKRVAPYRYGKEFPVIGVVGNVRQEGMHKAPQPAVYWPWSGGRNYLVRSNRKLADLLPELREAVRNADSTAFIERTLPLTEAVRDTIWRVQYSLVLLGGLSALALILALVGLYSTLSYVVRGRTGEIGLRMALGAGQREVLTLVLRYGLTIVLVGLLIGLAGSAALTRFLSTLLFGVTPTDPLTFAGVAGTILVTAALAAYLPARRASKVDPMVALRHE